MESKHESFLRQAREAFKQGDIDRAKSLLAPILIENPRHQEAALLFAECYGGEKRIELLVKAKEIDPESGFGKQAEHLIWKLSDELLETPKQPVSIGNTSKSDDEETDHRIVISEGVVIGGRFEIKERIKPGMYGTAWLAWDTKLEQFCVVKQLHEDGNGTTNTLKQEVRTLAQLSVPGHASIPKIFDTLAEESCLVMQYIDGKDLTAIEDISEGEALHDMRDMAGALVYMTNHKDGPKQHRDISPSNIVRAKTGMLDRIRNGWRPYIWLVDFGISAFPEGPGGAHQFRAPELKKGIKNDPRSDVYSLGTTFQWVLDKTGRLKKISSEFRKIIEAAAEHDLEKRLRPEFLFSSLDQLIALRRARQHFYGLLIVFAIAILTLLAVALPLVGRLQNDLVRARQTIDGQTVNLERIDRELQIKTTELNNTDAKLRQANADLEKAQSDLAAIERELTDTLDRKIGIGDVKEGELIGTWDADNWIFKDNRTSITVEITPTGVNKLVPTLFFIDPDKPFDVPNSDGNPSSGIDDIRFADSTNGTYKYEIKQLTPGKTYIIRVTVEDLSRGRYTIVVK